MQAIFMAAGASTRTEPLTLTRPKPMLPVLNEPLLAHQIRAVAPFVSEVVVVVGYRREMVEEHFGGSFEGTPIRYVVQQETRGTGHAVLQCSDVITSDTFLLFNGDDLYDPSDVKKLLVHSQGALAKEIADPRLYGVYVVDTDRRATRIVEKPKEIISTLCNVGAYKLPKSIFRILESTAPSERGEIEITSAIETLLGQTPFHIVPMEGYWLPIGYAWDLLRANEYFIEHFLKNERHGEVSPGAELNGTVYVAEGAQVRSGVVIDGPVYIGRNASVGPNCWLRPGTTLCDGTRAGHAVEIKNSILMRGSAVPHLSYVGDSIVGEYANLGAGTITANFRHDAKNITTTVKGQSVDTGRNKCGAIFADHVHTGINTSIYPGRKMWPHTVSFPGEVVRKDITEVKRVPQK
ncbi:MAG: hypothetical protein AMXMBFR84_01780 [Candidatus Hydrogenedentota bacterium]